MSKRKRLPTYRLLHITGNEQYGYKLSSMHEPATCITLSVIRPDVMREYFFTKYADKLNGDRLMLTAADLQEIRRDHSAQLAA